MEINNYEKTIVDFAYEIIDMHREIMRLRNENKRLKEYETKYIALLDSSIKHNDDMIGNIIKTYLK